MHHITMWHSGARYAMIIKSSTDNMMPLFVKMKRTNTDTHVNLHYHFNDDTLAMEKANAERLHYTFM